MDRFGEFGVRAQLIAVALDVDDVADRCTTRSSSAAAVTSSSRI